MEKVLYFALGALAVFVLIGLGLFLLFLLESFKEKRRQSSSSVSGEDPGKGGGKSDQDHPSSSEESETDDADDADKARLRFRIFSLAESLNPFYSQTSKPSDLLGHPAFLEAVELLRSAKFSTEELVSYGGGNNPIICCMAFEAQR